MLLLLLLRACINWIWDNVVVVDCCRKVTGDNELWNYSWGKTYLLRLPSTRIGKELKLNGWMRARPAEVATWCVWVKPLPFFFSNWPLRLDSQWPSFAMTCSYMLQRLSLFFSFSLKKETTPFFKETYIKLLYQLWLRSSLMCNN